MKKCMAILSIVSFISFAYGGETPIAQHESNQNSVNQNDGHKSYFDFKHGGKNVRVRSYVANGATKKAKVIFVMHGIKRNGEEYLEPWIQVADKHQCVILVPEFSKELWPKSISYNYGNVFTEKGDLKPKEKWAYTAIDSIFDEYIKQTNNKTKTYHIFGHSAGSQFVHRMLLLGAANKVDVAVSANAGSYTMPNFDIQWPYGLKGAPSDKALLKKALALNIQVLLGELDNDSKGKYLPGSKQAMAQGPHRLARGKTFFTAAQQAAKHLDAQLNWQLTTVPNVGHFNKLMVPHAVKLMFP